MSDMFRYQVEVCYDRSSAENIALGFDFEKYSTPENIEQIAQRLSFAFPLATVRVGIVNPEIVEVMFAVQKGKLKGVSA